jgi:hypothetical protein
MCGAIVSGANALSQVRKGVGILIDIGITWTYLN